MRVTIGRGNNRFTATAPVDRVGREQAAWDLKVLLHQRGVIKSLGR